MSTPRKKMFGPLFYSTVVVALLLTVYTQVMVHESAFWDLVRRWSDSRQERAWLEVLGSADSTVRDQATAVLVRMGSKKLEAKLIEAARSSNSADRRWAYHHLVDSQATDDVLVPLLTAGVNDGDAAVRLEVVHALGRLLGVPSPGYPGRPLMGLPMRRLTQAQCAEIGQALARLLKDPLADTRAAAADGLAELPPSPGAAAGLSAACADPDRAVRLAAARASLKHKRSDDPAVTRALVGLIADPEAIGDRMAIMDLVNEVGDDARNQAVRAMTSLLTDDNLVIQDDVFDCLAAAGNAARAALPAIERLLDHGDPFARATAGFAFARISGESSPRGLSILLRIIDDLALPYETREKALELVRALHPSGLVKATPVLIRQLGNQSADVRAYALQMLAGVVSDTPAEMPAPATAP